MIRRSAFVCLVLGGMLVAGCGGSGSPTAPTPATPPVADTPPPSTPPPTTPPPTTPPPTSAPTVLRSARFQGANGYITDGTATIVRTGEQHSLDLGSDFRTSQSSALDVRLCRDSRCSGDSLNLGQIQRFNGGQSYRLPNDAGAYRLVVIWCRAVGLPFGYGELR